MNVFKTYPNFRSNIYNPQGTLSIHKASNFMEPHHFNLLKRADRRDKSLDIET